MERFSVVLGAFRWGPPCSANSFQAQGQNEEQAGALCGWVMSPFGCLPSQRL